MSRSLFFFGIAAALSVVAACSPAPDATSSAGAKGGSAGSSGGGSSGAAGAGAIAGAAGDIGVGGFGAGPGSGGSAGSNNCSNNDPMVDDDKDGYSQKDGDCNDCDANVGPGSIEVVAVPDMNGMTPPQADEDCDGMIDNVPMPCDDNLVIDDTDAFHGANAIDICQKQEGKKWGVVSAAYTQSNGMGAPNPLQYGIMSKFGTSVDVRGGKRMLALSTGYARDLDDPNPCGSQNCKGAGPGTAPPNFPQQVCNASPNINDDVALDLKIKTPRNATGYSFNFKFYSFEFAEWVCTPYNDQFIALVSPAPPGSINGNISFDSKNNPVSVNIGFFDVCDPVACDTWAQQCPGGCPPKPMPCCPSGPGELAGTGFDAWDIDIMGKKAYAGGTSWLKTQAPIKGGTDLNIRFTIWDADDQNLDSTIVVDNFQWIANGGKIVIETVPDEPK